jgi:hypothetical protein
MFFPFYLFIFILLMITGKRRSCTASGRKRRRPSPGARASRPRYDPCTISRVTGRVRCVGRQLGAMTADKLTSLRAVVVPVVCAVQYWLWDLEAGKAKQKALLAVWDFKRSGEFGLRGTIPHLVPCRIVCDGVSCRVVSCHCVCGGNGTDAHGSLPN